MKKRKAESDYLITYSYVDRSRRRPKLITEKERFYTKSGAESFMKQLKKKGLYPKMREYKY